MTPVLAALLWKREEQKAKLDYKSLKYIQKWYWGSVFLERYAGAVETTTKRDYDDLIKTFADPSFIPAIFTEVDRQILNYPAFSLTEIHRINSIYKGVIGLIALEGAKDFMDDESIEFYSLDDHHIFPKAYLLTETKFNKEEINCVLNRTLISKKTNVRISDSKPSEYISDIIPLQKKETILRSHFINKNAIEAMEKNDFNKFIESREREILIKLRENRNII